MQMRARFVSEKPTQFAAQDLGRMVVFGDPEARPPAEAIVAAISSIKHTEGGTVLGLTAQGRRFKWKVLPDDTIDVQQKEMS